MNLSSYKKLTDDQIIIEIQKSKNLLIFDILYDRHSFMVYNKCLGFTKDLDDAKDLTQEVFIKLFLKLKDYKAQGKFKSWLYVFTYNTCINYVNRSEKHKNLKSNIHIEELDSLHIEVSDTSLFQLKVENLDKMLMQINPEDKMLLLLKYQDELTIKELSEMYLISESAIKMRLKRAKAKLVKLNSLNS